MLSEKITDFLTKKISKSELIRFLLKRSDHNYNIEILGNYLLVFDLKSNLDNLVELIKNDNGFRTDEEYEFFSKALNSSYYIARYYGIEDRAYSDSYEYVREDNYICDLNSNVIEEKILEYARKLGVKDCQDLIKLLGEHIDYDRISDEHASQRIDHYTHIAFSNVEHVLKDFLKKKLGFSVLNKEEKTYYISLTKFLKNLKAFERDASEQYITFTEYISKVYYNTESMDEDLVYEFIDECFWETSVTDTEAYEKVIIDVLEDAYIEALEKRKDIKTFNEIINFIEKKLKLKIGSYSYEFLPKDHNIEFRIKGITIDNKIIVDYKNVGDHRMKRVEMSFDNFKLFLYHPELDLK